MYAQTHSFAGGPVNTREGLHPYVTRSLNARFESIRKAVAASPPLWQIRILSLPSQGVVSQQQIQVAIDTQNLHDGQVRPHSHSGVTSLKIAQRDCRHSRALREMFGGKAPPQAGHTQTLAKLLNTQFGDLSKRGHFFSHGRNYYMSIAQIEKE